LPSTREVIAFSYSYVRALILVPLELSSIRGEVKLHGHSRESGNPGFCFVFSWIPPLPGIRRNDVGVVKFMAEKILVVEDDVVIRKSISQTLQEEGYEVDEASDGAQAVGLLNERRFDLVISDFVMPRMDGLKVVEQVHSISPQTPVIFLTGYLSRKSAESLLHGMAEFVQKPVTVELLLAKVQRLLRPKVQH
jgi:CheY-like chemotaxis protein